MLIQRNTGSLFSYTLYWILKRKISENLWQNIFSQVHSGHAQYGVTIIDHTRLQMTVIQKSCLPISRTFGSQDFHWYMVLYGLSSNIGCDKSLWKVAFLC